MPNLVAEILTIAILIKFYHRETLIDDVFNKYGVMRN